MWPTGVWKRKPTASPTQVTRTSVNVVRATDAIVPPARIAAAAHRQRAEAVGDALRHVLGDLHGQRRAAEERRLHDDAGDQVVGVRPVAGDVDRAAEDVAEEQHEDHGLDRCEDDDLRRARERQQVAPRDHARVGEERLHARALHRSGGDRAHAAARPLRPKRRRGALAVDRRRGVLGAAAGEREEHVVERGPVDAEVVDRDAGLLDRARGRRAGSRRGP